MVQKTMILVAAKHKEWVEIVLSFGCNKEIAEDIVQEMYYKIQLKLEKGLDKVNVEAAWRDLMGNGVNNYTNSVKLHHDTLYIELSSSVLREELSYGKDKIIKIINEALGKNLVNKLVLR